VNRPWRAPSRLWLVVPVAIMAAAAALAALRPLSAPAGGEGSGRRADGESAGLARCRAAPTGSAAADCEAVWRAARARFLGVAP
jgi:conjugative transfer region protein TrbK